MPVRKFRDIAEMEGNTWREPGSPELFRAICETWDFATRTLQPHFPPGVYKHRSLEDAQKLREEWAQANFRAYRERLARRLEP
jgi:glutathione S-transferase